jgi:type VI secretion system protein ImpI
MTLRLSIENVDRLPDGGPLRIEVKGRGLDLGRDTHLDWTLPDSSRSISGKHCEIRFRDGGYWLYDVSKNGTFVNGAQYRLEGPYLLLDGDRLNIGPYIIAVSVEGQQAPRLVAAADAVAPDIWGAQGDAAAPDERRAYHQAREPLDHLPDFLDFAASVGPVTLGATDAPEVDDWIASPTSRPAPQALAMPSPRRPEPVRSQPQATTPEAPAVFDSPSESAVAADAQAKDILKQIAQAAGIPEAAVADRDPHALAEEIGAAIRLTAQNLAQMLYSRAESKTLMRSSSRTMIRAIENNPLKFTSSVDEALGIMFASPNRQYLDARTTIERSFSDLKTHEILTYGAMQKALETLFEDLAPERIDHAVEPDRGLTGIIQSRKAKLWDIYVERWRAKAKRADGRLLEAFMTLFAEAYDRLRDKGP